MSEVNLEKLREHGLLPDTFQIMTFTVHCECGFGVPASKFLERVYRHYKIEIAQMLPNTIAMLSVFCILCEAWLGVEPYLDLWRYYYSDMYHVTNLFVGLVGYYLRTKGEYIVFLVKSSSKGFAEKWFYIDL
jgi:hypothetical protein